MRLARGWLDGWMSAGFRLVVRLDVCSSGYETTVMITTRTSSSRTTGARDKHARSAIGDVLGGAAEVDTAGLHLAESELIAPIGQDRGDALRSEKAAHHGLRHDVAIGVVRRVLQTTIDAPRPQRVHAAERLVLVVAGELAEHFKADVLVDVGANVDAWRFLRHLGGLGVRVSLGVDDLKI